MTPSELCILDPGGDTRITWDHTDLAERERVRAEVRRLKAAGYLFFLVDGTPADEVTAAGGQGELVARLATEADLVGAPEPEAEAAAPAPETKRRGRPRRVRAIATPALQGG